MIYVLQIQRSFVRACARAQACVFVKNYEYVTHITKYYIIYYIDKF